MASKMIGLKAPTSVRSNLSVEAQAMRRSFSSRDKEPQLTTLPAMAAPPRKRIAVLGSLNIDLVSYVARHPLPGETLTSSRFATAPGGKGANQAAAVGRLSRTADALADGSVDVAMLGAVGCDAYADVLRSSLAACGVDTGGLRALQGQRTGLAIVVVDEPSGQNRIILSPEANHALAPADFAALPEPRPDLLVMQLEIRLDTVLQALAAANAARVPVLLNPAPAQALPRDAYAGLAHLILNETEAAILAACPESDLDDEPGLQRVGSLFLGRGVDNVVVTLGARGVYYATKAGKSALIPALEVDVVETTAAGDTFVGSYALAAVQAGPDGFDIDEAVKAANRAAAITVSRRGSQLSIPWKNELE